MYSKILDNIDKIGKLYEILVKLRFLRKKIEAPNHSAYIYSLESTALILDHEVCQWQSSPHCSWSIFHQ